MALERSSPVQDDSLTPPDSSEAGAPTRASADEGLKKGTQLANRYILLEGVGSGGQGVVYAAYDQRLERKVALKLLRNDVTQGAGLLLKEAQTAGKLSHPNVVIVHNVESWAGQTFIAMEFKSRGTLSA